MIGGTEQVSNVDIVPRMKRLGMPEMKRLTVHLAEKYDRPSGGGRMSQLGFVGHMYEICNFAQRGLSVREIARALNHELPGRPISADEVLEICQDLEELGYMSLDERKV